MSMNIGSMGRAIFADRIHVFDTLDSTSSWLIRQEFEQPAICVAHQQTHGYGRRNKIWQGPKGNLALSCSMPSHIFCSNPAEGISLIVALAVRSALESYGVSAQVKWPNDLLAGGSKCAGILIHIQHWHQKPYIIIGIGINNRHAPYHQSTSIYEQTKEVVDSIQLATKVMDVLIEFLIQNRKHGFQDFRNLWIKYDSWYGKQVQLVHASQTVTGRHMGIDGSGRILLDTDNQLCSYSSGEVSLRQAIKS